MTLEVGGDGDRRGMPGKATDAMKKRTKFVLEWERRWSEAEAASSTWPRHEALRMRRPAVVPVRSRRAYPCLLARPSFGPVAHVARVDKNGAIRWNRRSVFISSALKHEYVELEESCEFDARLRAQTAWRE